MNIALTLIAWPETRLNAELSVFMAGGCEIVVFMYSRSNRDCKPPSCKNRSQRPQCNFNLEAKGFSDFVNSIYVNKI